MYDHIKRIPHALRESGLSGWLFYNVYYRDHVSDTILEVPADVPNSRPWACLVCADGSVHRIVHSVEAHSLDHLPGKPVRYSSRDEFLQRLRTTCGDCGPIALNYSDTIPALSLVDHGIVMLLQELSITTVSAATLIQRVLGVLDDAARASHERAAVALRTILDSTWRRLAECVRGGTKVTEGNVRDWIADGFRTHGLVAEDAPIVAASSNSNDPHYQPSNGGTTITAHQIVQFDLWAKEPHSRSVYADIAWVAYTGDRPPAEMAAAFDAVRSARDGAVAMIRERLQRDAPVSGADVDQHARSILQEHGLLSYTRHRTGHAIDTRVHGIGVNLDSVEFPDRRPLLEGSCFSIEPGIYQEAYGMHSEINGYVRDRNLVISGGEPQREILVP